MNPGVRANKAGVEMDTEHQWNMRLRLLEEREHQIILGLEEMGPDDMRWVVRYLGDALTEERWRTLLSGYQESLPSDRMRQFLQRLIPECTQLGVLDLHATRDAEAESLQSLTDTDLQSMPAMEKWQMIAREPRGLDPHRIARELARLTFCLQPDLLDDAMLPRAAIEFPFYFRLQQALRQLPVSEIYRLADAAAICVPALGRLSAAEAMERLASLRQEITRTAGFSTPVQELLGASMELLPKEFFPPASHEEIAEDRLAERLRQVESLSLQDLRLSLRAQADHLSLQEFQELLEPYRSQYPSLGQMPVETLRRLVATLDVCLEDRGVCDFIQRYRTGKFLAVPPITGEVWNLLPHEDRLRLLERDNADMDIAQMARHLGKIFLSHEYQILDTAESQLAIVLSSRYQNLVERLTHLGEENRQPKIVALNHAVTGLVLTMEESPREGRSEKLDQIRRLIGEALGLSEQDLAAPRA